VPQRAGTERDLRSGILPHGAVTRPLMPRKSWQRASWSLLRRPVSSPAWIR